MGAWVTAMVIISVLGLARGIEKLFFSESRRNFKELSDKYSELSEKFNENTIERMSLKDYIEIQGKTIDSINEKSGEWAFKSGQKDKQIKDLKNASVLREKTVNILRIDLLEAMEELERERMNLNPKYNPNVTRGLDGRYKSLT